MKKIFFILLITVTNVVYTQTQLQINNFYIAPELYNVAAISRYNNPNMLGMYNTIFNGITGYYQSGAVQLSMPLHKVNSAFGLMYNNEKSGFQNTQTANAAYAYSLKLNELNSVYFGLGIGFVNHQFDMSKAVVIQKSDPIYLQLLNNSNSTIPDLKIGVMGNFHNIILGLSANRFLRSSFKFNNIGEVYNVQQINNAYAEIPIKLGDNFSIKPSVLFSQFNLEKIQYASNLSMHYMDKIWIGGGISSNKLLSINLGFKNDYKYLLAYSYNLGINKSAAFLGKTHELMLGIPLSNEKLMVSKEVDIVEKNEMDSVVPEKIIRIKSDVLVKNFEQMKLLDNNLDTSGIALISVKEQTPKPGFYVVVFMSNSENSANNKIKQLYMNNISAFKFLDPQNNNYYVYIKYVIHESAADNFVLNNKNPLLDEAWVRTVK